MSTKTNKNYTPAYNRSPAKGSDGKGSSGKHYKAQESLVLFKKRFITLGAIAFALAVVLILSLVFAVYQQPYLKESVSDAAETPTSNGKIANGDFKVTLNSVNSQYPQIPSGWTQTKQSPLETIGGVITTAVDSQEKVKRDLLGLMGDTTKTNDIINNTIFGTKLPDAAIDGFDFGDDDEYNENLMMLYNSKSSYQKAVSSSFTIWGGEYAKVRVWIKTGAAGTGSAYIALRVGSTTTTHEVLFTGINTNNEWVPYDVYLEADPAWSKTFYLDVGLGEKDNPETGIVLFGLSDMTSLKKAEYILMSKIDEGKYDGLPIPFGDLQGATGGTSLPATKQVKSYDEKISEENLLEPDPSNPIWANLQWNLANAGKTASADFVNQKDSKGNYHEYPFYDANDILSLDNRSGSVKSKNFSVKSFEVMPSTASNYYRISFWIKTEEIAYNEGAYVYLKAYRDGTVYESAKSVYMSKIRTASTDDVHSGWSNCVFFIKPSNTDRYTLELTVSIGKEQPLVSDSATKGIVYATEFEMFEISKSDFNSASGGDRNTKVDLENTGTSTGSITNGNFNTPVPQASGDSNLALHPDGWKMVYEKKSVGADNKITYYEDFDYGIVPKNKSGDSNYFLPLTTSAGANIENVIRSLPGGDNVFAISDYKTNSGGLAFTVRSNEFSLSPNSSTLISVLVYTEVQYLKYLNVSLKNDLDMSFNLQSYSTTPYKSPVDYSFFDVSATNYYPATWLKLNFLVTTGELEKSTYLEISFGKPGEPAPARSWLVIDEARTNTLSETNYDTIIEEAFNVDDTNEDELLLNAKDEYKNIKGKDFTKIDLPEEEEDADDEDEEDVTDDTNKEPFNWLYLSSIIFGVAVIIGLVAMIIRRFKFFRKREKEHFDDEYKRQ